jgi:hypothetical protein
MRYMIKVVLVNFAVFGMLIIVLEGVLIAVHPINPLWNSNLSKSGWRWSDSPYPEYLIRTGIRGPRFWSDHESNQFGFRGRNIEYTDEDYVVLLVGNSQVEAAASNFEDLPETMLERYLKAITQKHVRVFSIGASGWSQDQQLLALQDYFQQFRANLIAIWHTPNDYWENAFPDRSLANDAGHLKPVFFLEDQQGGKRIELFHPALPDHKALHILHRSNMGRILLKLAVALRILDIKSIQPNEQALRAWLSVIPPTEGHETVTKSQCPAEIVPWLKFFSYYSEYVGRAITLATNEAIEESRSQLTPFLEPLSLRDRYAKQITHVLMERIKALAQFNGAEFLVFAPEFTLNGIPILSEIRCATKDGKFYRVSSDWLAPMEAWKASINFEKLIIEIGHYGFSSVTVDRRDRHLNVLGNELVMQVLAERVKRIHPSGWPNSADVSRSISR